MQRLGKIIGKWYHSEQKRGKMCISKPEENMLQQLRQADEKSCKKRMDFKHDIYAMLFRVNFRMS